MYQRVPSPRIQSVMANPRTAASVSRILVTDHDPEVRGAFATKLQRAGYRAIEAKSGTEALLRLRSERFQVLVLDLDIPDWDGFEMLKTVKEEHPGVHVLVVAKGPLVAAAECLGATVSIERWDASRLLVRTIRKLVGKPD